MFAIVILLSALSSSSSIPVPTLDESTNHGPLVVLGRELPECMKIARFRTLQEIVMSCLVTIFACTWLAIHPNLPGPYDCAWTKLKRKVTIMVYAILAPELITMWAMRQWFNARKIAKEFTEKDGRDPTGTQVATTGGTETEGNVENRRDIESKALVDARTGVEAGQQLNSRKAQSHWAVWFNDGPHQLQSREWTIVHGFLLQMGGFMLCDGEKPLWVLEAKEFRKLIDEGKVDLPRISEDEINDKSKGDSLTKLFVVVQTTWFIIQCFARWIKHLPITELEVVTLAFAALNIITYGFWWNKPQNVLVAISVPIKSGADSEPQLTVETKKHWLWGKLREARECGCCGWVFCVPWRLFTGFLRPLRKLLGTTGFHLPSRSLRVPMFYVDGVGKDILDFGGDRLGGEPKADFPILAIGVFFGALHLIPWSFDFPSTIERWLWRSSALVITIQPILLFLLALAKLADTAVTLILYLVSVSLFFLGIPFYFLARFTLLVLAFTTLPRALPRDAYANIPWATFIPHV